MINDTWTVVICLTGIIICLIMIRESAWSTCMQSTLRIMRDLDRERLNLLLSDNYSDYAQAAMKSQLFLSSRGLGEWYWKAGGWAITPAEDHPDLSDLQDR